MRKRPLSVTIIAAIFILVGIGGLVSHGMKFDAQHPFDYDGIWVLLVEVLAIVCGVFLLLGRNWARWLALAWIAFHVAISMLNTVQEVVVHSILLAVFAFFLLRRAATDYFRGPANAI